MFRELNRKIDKLQASWGRFNVRLVGQETEQLVLRIRCEMLAKKIDDLNERVNDLANTPPSPSNLKERGAASNKLKEIAKLVDALHNL